jgi:predicted Zn-dependent protease
VTGIALDLARRVLDVGGPAVPGGELRVRVRSERTAYTRYARNEITAGGDVSGPEIWVNVALGRRQASARGNQADDASLRALVERAASFARLSPEDPERMPLLGPQRYATVPPARDGEAGLLFDPDRRMQACAGAIVAAEEAKLVGAGFYRVADATEALVTSAGLATDHPSSEVGFTTTARTPDGTGSGWAGAESHLARDVDLPALARVAIDKAVRSARPRDLEPGRYTVVLDPVAVADLLSFLVEAMDARRADEGRSFFARPGGGTRVGETIFADLVTLDSDPTSPETPGAPFDWEGFPLAPLTWIERGTIRALSTTRFWASRQGRAPTGKHEVYRLAGGAAERTEDLFEGVDRGLYITRFWYTRWLDPQTVTATGLTRDGVFLIENGRITGPTNNFRFNESPVTVLKNVDGLTMRTFRVPLGGWRVPALRTHGFNLASRSAAV